MNTILHWWLTPKFPQKHIDNILAYKPAGNDLILRNFYRTWIVHPIRRRLARLYLSFLKNIFGLKVIALTGSAGKTTTKEMLASILKFSGRTVYSFANIDPVYNIPTTIFKCTPMTRYLILEMGVEYPEEMDFYLWLATPDVGIVTNVSATHLEFFGNVEGVAREKIKLVKAVPKDGVSVLNIEDKRLNVVGPTLVSKKLMFGDGGDVYASSVVQDQTGSTKFTLNYKKVKKNVQIPYLGKHFVQNALAASAAAVDLGISLDVVARGLASVEKPEHRMTFINSRRGYLIVDDTYNANPSAVKQTLRTFSTVVAKGKKIFVFGEMKELGETSAENHKEVGKEIASSKLESLFTVGPFTKYTIDSAVENGLSKSKAFYFQNNSDLIKSLVSYIKPGDAVLIKGSRSMRLEEVVEALK